MTMEKDDFRTSTSCLTWSVYVTFWWCRHNAGDDVPIDLVIAACTHGRCYCFFFMTIFTTGRVRKWNISYKVITVGLHNAHINFVLQHHNQFKVYMRWYINACEIPTGWDDKLATNSLIMAIYPAMLSCILHMKWYIYASVRCKQLSGESFLPKIDSLL